MKWSPHNSHFTSGIRSGRSLLIDEGALPWIVQNANNDAAPVRRHIELALCHLAQHGQLNSPLLKINLCETLDTLGPLIFNLMKFQKQMQRT